MPSRNLTCIACPKGCAVVVEIEGVEIKRVTGQKCKRGKEYALEEIIAPRRFVTSTVPLVGGFNKMLPVRTRSPIPKELVVRCVQELSGVAVEAPVEKGEVIIANILDTGVDLIASRSERGGHTIG